MEIVAIGDVDTTTAFKLAGVTAVYPDDDGRGRLPQILADDAVGVLILTERFAQEHQRLLEEHKASRRLTPIVVEVPDIRGPIQRESDPIRELIRRAIGADIK